MFDPAKIKVENRARGGRSSRTFLTEGLWDQALDAMQPGDFVLMQFGHNDGGAINDTSRARGSIKGTSEETEEIDNLLTKRHEVVHSYGWYLRKFIADAKAKGATPIVLSPIPRNIWKEGRVARASEDYGKWNAEVARVGGALFIDLNEIIARSYEEIGVEKVGAEFFTSADHTHTSPAGARLNAECVMMAKPLSQMPYQTVGDLWLTVPAAPIVANYRRDLNLDAAIAIVTYQVGGTQFTREVFASPVDQAIVVRLTANQPGQISFTAGMQTPQQAAVTAEGADLVMRGVNGEARGIAGAVKFQTRIRVLAACRRTLFASNGINDLQIFGCL